jgi:hypothetical protein
MAAPIWSQNAVSTDGHSPHEGTVGAVCEWFALCTRPADGVVAHPIIGPVPTCQRCAERMEQRLDPFPLI